MQAPDYTLRQTVASHGLPLPRQAGRAVIMIQLDETSGNHIVTPRVEVEETGVTAITKAFFVVPPRV